MIVVLGSRPRTGTSVLMAMLVAGGLDPVRDDTGVSDAYPTGAFQHREVLIGDAAGTLREVPPRAAVKLFPRHILDLSAAGIHPAMVVLAVRDAGESDASWDAVWPERSRQDTEGQEAVLAAALGLLTDAAVPVLPVGFHDLLDHPEREAQRIARFLGSDLDVDAMAKVPDAQHRHFGGPAGN